MLLSDVVNTRVELLVVVSCGCKQAKSPGTPSGSRRQHLQPIKLESRCCTYQSFPLLTKFLG